MRSSGVWDILSWILGLNDSEGLAQVPVIAGGSRKTCLVEHVAFFGKAQACQVRAGCLPRPLGAIHCVRGKHALGRGLKECMPRSKRPPSLQFDEVNRMDAPDSEVRRGSSQRPLGSGSESQMNFNS